MSNDTDNNKAANGNGMPGRAPAYEGELSFGLEFEFLFYFKAPWADAAQGPDAVAVDREEEARLPPALSLPGNVRWSYSDYYPLLDADDDGVTARDWASSLLRKAILSVPGARIQGEPMPDGTDPSYLDMYVVGDDHEKEYAGWCIDNDASVRDDGIQIRGYDYLSFELTTPALWDRPESHRHVYLVVQELVKRFRLRVNVSTGLHCHVGAGLWKPLGEGSDEEDDEEDDGDDDVDEPGFEPVKPAIPFRGTKHDLGVFKRAAALLWAADGFLCHAHPPERGLNRYSPPLRLCSRLAHGMSVGSSRDARGFVQIVERQLDGGDVPEEEEEEKEEEKEEEEGKEDLLPEQALPSAEAEARYRTVVSGFSREINPAPEKLRVLRVRDGVAHLLRCRNHAEVAALLTPPDRVQFAARLNYNFSQYLSPFASVSGRTVEFRESTGSLSPAWVAAWSAVCLGVFRFAATPRRPLPRRKGKGKDRVDGEDDDKDARRRRHRYDAISLLLDIGLFAEAALLESRLRPRDVGGDPVRAWYPCRLADPPPPSPSWLPKLAAENSCLAR
ncbi:hypothetical protein VTH06DRAFT_8112 [Thermothelomyces fergusii]